MNKKGFTLIELLAVIVILAIIALIVTPIVSNIIASARNSANQRSVEGHIGNIEYAIVGEAFNNNKDISFMDGTITTLTLSIPDNDKITCDSYLIENGLVMEAKGCIDISAGWNKSYDYKKDVGTSGENAVTSYNAQSVGYESEYTECTNVQCALNELYGQG